MRKRFIGVLILIASNLFCLNVFASDIIDSSSHSEFQLRHVYPAEEVDE